MLMTSRRKKKAMYKGLMIGGAVGSIFTLLYTPKSGREVRSDIKEGLDKSVDAARVRGEKIAAEAKEVANSIVEQSNHLMQITRDYAAGKYQGTAEAFQNEYNRIRSAIQGAINAYKNYDVTDKTTQDIVEDIFDEYEEQTTLPKNEGMGRRRRKS